MVSAKKYLGDYDGLLLVLVVCILLLTSAACKETPVATKAVPEKITIAYPMSTYSTLFSLAYSRGYFAAEGLDVLPQQQEFGKMAIMSMLEGKADIALSSDTVTMFAIFEGKKITILAENMTSKRNEAIVARKDRNIQKPKDLEGKRIGVTMKTTGHFFLESFLSVNMVGKEKLTVIDMKPNEMVEALTKGTVDAVAVWQPHINRLERALGDRATVFYDERIYSDIVCLTAFKDYVHNNPETVKKVLKALIRAETFIKQYPEESRLLASEFLKIDKNILDETWSTLHFSVTLDQSLLVSLEDVTDWAMANQFVTNKEKPNYMDYLYFDALDSIHPEAVRVIR